MWIEPTYVSVNKISTLVYDYLHVNIIQENMYFVFELLIFGIAYQITWWRLIL